MTLNNFKIPNSFLIMIFIVFNGTSNGFDTLILPKIIKNNRHKLPKENCNKINKPLVDKI